MEHVLWVGGGCGSGKTSIARELAHGFDLQVYPVDAHGYDHLRRLGGRPRPSFDELWLASTPEELAERFVSATEERLPLILADLDGMRDGPLVIAEGPLLFPALVAAHVASPAHGVWLVPTEEFQERALRKRGGMSPTSDPERALRNRLARDAILHRLNRRQAAELGCTVIEVDGSRTLAEMEEVVAAHLGERIAAGPRARDGVERRRIRRAENTAIHDNLVAYVADAGIAEAPAAPFACECTTLGCRERVMLPIDEYGRALEQPSRFITGGHVRDAEEVTP
jgi:hypothetical protein